MSRMPRSILSDTIQRKKIKPAVEEIAEQLANGNDYAWFCAKVTASWKGHSHSEYLGWCSYASEKDWLESDYFQQMKDEALGFLNSSIQEEFQILSELIVPDSYRDQEYNEEIQRLEDKFWEEVALDEQVLPFIPGAQVEVAKLFAYPDMWGWAPGYTFVSAAPDNPSEVFVKHKSGFYKDCVVRERLDRIRKAQ